MMGVQVTAQLRCPECNYLHDLMIDLGIVPLPTVHTCVNTDCMKFFAMRPIFPESVEVETWRMIPPNVVEGGHAQPVDESTAGYAFDAEARAQPDDDAWRRRFG